MAINLWNHGPNGWNEIFAVLKNPVFYAIINILVQ